MQKSQMLGRIFVAVSLVVFGVQHFMYGGFVAGLVPAFMPGRLFWAYFVGVAFVAAAVGIFVDMLARPAATMLGVMFFLFLILLHIPRIVVHPRDGNEWTSGLVALGMCGGAWILASASPLYERETADPFLKIGPYFFGLAMIGFGIQHFIDARNTARVGPPWNMEHPLWPYVTGGALLAGGAAIVLGKKARSASILLATIISLFFLFLHMPRIIMQPHNPGPWTSGFEVLALCGCALVFGNTLPKEEKA
jgi:uncharacterized membrane protein YphA (DoxX/SURF4 family)